MKILFLIPDLSKPGGVANYYKAIRSSMPENVRYFTRGTRMGSGKIGNAFTFFADYFRFIVSIFSKDVVLINTSFAASGVLRDALFCLICRVFNRPYIIFFRGWEPSFEKKCKAGLFGFIFRISFLRSRKILVLSADFAGFLKSMGYKNRIVVETTVVDESLYKDQDIEQLVRDRKDTIPKMLFLSRLEKNKGIMECLEIHKKLTELGYENQLLVAGSGSAKKMLDELTGPGIIRLGHVSGLSKINAYSKAHFYLFPSTHAEGMPNSVLEAMMFGLPVITTRIGGIKDFFDESMGISTDQPDVDAYVRYIIKLIDGQIDLHEIAVKNNRYATAHFSQEVVAERLLKEIYN